MALPIPESGKPNLKAALEKLAKHLESIPTPQADVPLVRNEDVPATLPKELLKKLETDENPEN